ncbi:hypothetical protein HGO97_004365 [Faecalicatena sp. AGMB00832]|uniref:Alpha-L-rhamnosidase-like protein n=1 Tax=Faecalicatena faecalis TaxID=2726362 RepID=A0ABS6D0X7_9FIRM|nr:glycosyl hydrolase [Faecalicatena faecalis]MBU3875046.1 hypothetical protein [Faecalicatena faecalis]
MKKDYIFPFFWQHGEEEETLRDYMRVIKESNVDAVCVESRPHPDFCGEKWWHDMDIILDEAKKRQMKVWILDDSHFPTGFANGAMEKKPIGLHRQSVYCYRRDAAAGDRVCFDAAEEPELPLSGFEQMMQQFGAYQKPERLYYDEVILDARAVRIKEDGAPGEVLELSLSADGKKVEFTPEEGNWRVYVTYLTRNAGGHRQYINMLDRESCRILIDEVYEKHFEHYGVDFGSTIMGFFSDEPELGNGGMYPADNILGTDQDLPWSRELEQRLSESLGEQYAEKLYLLWENGANPHETAKVRYAYMDAVTKLVRECFSEQIGSWCREHGVLYIGHLIEDNNQHARTGSSLGHYFRGLAGQDMAGIDNIGNQVLPQGEDLQVVTFLSSRDGEFYHFVLGKLGVSSGAIDPKKHGRTMCEIFGNYGWEEGVRLEKYLADHFMVRGVNRFVPHAFSPKEYPDPDCPPHFYAGGHNPQYRHFGWLMRYMNRVCTLLDGGKTSTRVAILYHAEAEWTGKCMLMQKPARVLAEMQIDYHFLPADVFCEPEKYHANLDNGLKVNGYEYRVLLIPYAQYIGKSFAQALEKLPEDQCGVIFVGGYPEGYYDSDDTLSERIATLPMVEQKDLKETLGKMGVFSLADAAICPADKDIRILHYLGAEDVFYIVNEGKDAYEGELLLSDDRKRYEYDPWRDCCYPAEMVEKEGILKMPLSLSSGETCFLMAGTAKEEMLKEKCRTLRDGEPGIELLDFTGEWTRSIAAAAKYPDFTGHTTKKEFRNVGEELPDFSGVIRYENSVKLDEVSRNVYLEIDDAWEGVEVFVNGASQGILVQKPFLYSLGTALHEGTNEIRIEVATTLERERCQDPVPGQPPKKFEDCKPTGIVGEVKLYRR